MPRTSQAAICDSKGNILSVINAPPLTLRNDPNINENLQKTLFHICAQIGISFLDFVNNVTKICVAMAGVYLPQDEIVLRGIIQNIGFKKLFSLVICENMYADLISSLHNVGVAVRAGTGSCVFVRMPNIDEPIRVDGWGNSLGDDGSGYDLGRKCLRALLKAEDGRKPPSKLLLDKVLNHVGLIPGKNNASDLVQWYYDVYKTVRWRANISDLSIPLFAAAEENDPLAYMLVIKGADDLFDSFCTAMKLAKKRIEGSNPERMDVILVGGLFDSGGLYLRRFESLVIQNSFDLINKDIIKLKYGSIIGTMLLAIKGKKVYDKSDETQNYFLNEAEKRGLLKT